MNSQHRFIEHVTIVDDQAGAVAYEIPLSKNVATFVEALILITANDAVGVTFSVSALLSGGGNAIIATTQLGTGTGQIRLTPTEATTSAGDHTVPENDGATWREKINIAVDTGNMTATVITRWRE